VISGSTQQANALDDAGAVPFDVSLSVRGGEIVGIAGVSATARVSW